MRYQRYSPYTKEIDAEAANRTQDATRKVHNFGVAPPLRWLRNDSQGMLLGIDLPEQRRQRSSAAASGAVQQFFISYSGPWHMDAWWARPMTTIPPTSSELPTDADTTNVWVMKPPNLRGTGLHNIPVIRVSTGQWYRHVWISTFTAREVYRGTSSTSQPALIRIEEINPNSPSHDINVNATFAGQTIPESFLYRQRLNNVILAAPIVDSTITIDGTPVEWVDLNINGKHWVRKIVLAGDDLPEDWCGVF